MDVRVVALNNRPSFVISAEQESALSNENHGSQSGDNSLNVGVGDFRGAHVNINRNERPMFTPEQLNIQRHPALGGRGVSGESVSTFGYLSGSASVIGLYFTLFQGTASSWSTFFMFLFAMGLSAVVIAAVLRRCKFEHFLGARHYLEMSNRGRLYVNRLTADCPWCGTRMHLRHLGPKEGPKDDVFVCERNPRQHTIDLDPTVLPEIED